MKNFILSIPKGLPSAIMVLVTLFFMFTSNPLGIKALKVFRYAEQVGYMILFFCVALVFILDYAKSRLPHHSKVNQEIVLAATTAVFALVIEIVHDWMPGYGYSMSNVMAATLGAFLAFLFYHYWLLHPMRYYLYHSIQHHWRYQHRRKKKK